MSFVSPSTSPTQKSGSDTTTATGTRMPLTTRQPTRAARPSPGSARYFRVYSSRMGALRRSTSIAARTHSHLRPDSTRGMVLLFHPARGSRRKLPDVFHAVGYPGYPFPRGDLTVTEAPDVFAAQGFERDSGVWHSAELQDSFNALATLPVRGPWASTGAQDTFHATGLGRGENGTWITTEAQDIFHATGQTPFAGSFNVTETPDRFKAFGSGVVRHQRRRVFFTT
jgi:hypothetical protein